MSVEPVSHPWYDDRVTTLWDPKNPVGTWAQGESTYATIWDAIFTGCTGLERVSNVKEALCILRIENHAIAFVEALHNGKFHDMSDEEYDRLLDSVKSISELLLYPDDPEIQEMLLNYFIDKIYAYDDHLEITG